MSALEYSKDADEVKFVGWYRDITPERLGEPAPGQEGHDPDLHCMKLKFISPQMQREEMIAEKKLNKQFVDEPVNEPQTSAVFLIPKTNLRIPFNWFDYDSDAAAFIRGVARCQDVCVNTLGKSGMGTSLCIFLDTVWRHRHLRMKRENDPPSMGLQERRIRHWKAVIDESSLARGFTLRLVRHVILMLVGASFDFARSNGRRIPSSALGDKIEKLCYWFKEHDPADLKAFEDFQPERRRLPSPRGDVEPRAHRRGWAPGYEKSKKRKREADTYRPVYDRKRKADTYRPAADSRQKRQCLSRPRLSIKLPERIAERQGGKRDRDER